ncbi:MAG: PAS domain S-box protein, partial [Bacteroidales bacterium]|nr:PAS domain S-box protein [Bacteroidales bacterium]
INDFEKQKIVLESLFYENSSIMLMINPETGKIVETNQAACNYYGYSYNQLISMNINEINTATKEEIYEQMQKAKKDESKNFFFKHKLANNEIRDVEIYSGKVNYKGQMMLYSIIHDISERKKAEQINKEIEEKFSKAFQNSPVPLEIIELETIKYFDVNNEFLNHWGYTRDEVIGKTPADLNFVEKEQMKLLVERIKKERSLKNLELVFKTKSGEERNILRSAVIINIGGNEFLYSTSIDITEQKKVEKALKLQNQQLSDINTKLDESEKKFHLLADTTPAAIMMYQDNKWLYANKAASEITGYSNNELLEMNFWDIVHPDFKEYVKKRGEERQEGKSTIKRYEFKIICKSGEEKWVDLSGTSTIFNNKPAGIISVFDITKQKIAEDNLKRQNYEYEALNEEYKVQNEELILAKEKAEESNKLKTEFLHNMSHEIRTPMNGILGFADLLNKDDLSENKRKYYINIIKNSGEQLLRVIDDILEISRLETKQIKLIEEKISINDLILELFSIFDIKAKENKVPLYVKKTLTDKKSYIYTDKAKLIKILSNLIENAIKFTENGFIEIGYDLIDDVIQIYVKDTGVGINKDKFDLIFERFSQENIELSSKVGGLGLGLSIAKENAELLGGKISLISKKGEGTTFFISIPYKPANITDLNINISDNLEFNKQYIVLIVEDEEVNCLYIETLLENINPNIKTIHAINGEEAVEICKINNEIDIVLMDIKMPKMNGYQATKLIKEFKPDLPIIAQTAYSTSEDKAHAFSVGFDEFITKPISEESLKKILDLFLK